MNLKLILSALFLVLTLSAGAQMRFFGGIEGSYYKYVNSTHYDGDDFNRDELITESYRFGLNAGVFLKKNLSIGIGYRRGARKTSAFINHNLLIEEVYGPTHTLLLFGRHQLMRRKFGLVSEMQFGFESVKDIKMNDFPNDVHFKESTFSVAYIPRIIYYPVQNLSVDLALFQIRYFHTNRVEKDVSKQTTADYEMDFSNGPTLGIHYYFNLGPKE